MSRKQIERDLGELYIGSDVKTLTGNYYKKKRKEMLFLACAAIVLSGVVFAKEWQSSDMGDRAAILRNENGEGEKQIFLEVKRDEGPWQEFSFKLQEKEYTQKELESKYEEAIQVLPILILGENQSLYKVTSDLNLIQEVENTPFLLTWESSNGELIDSQGKLGKEAALEKPETAELRVKFSYREWSREHLFYLRIYPEEKDIFLSDLEQEVTKAEKKSREEAEFILPQKLEEEVLEWRYPRENPAIVMGVGLFLLLPVISYQKDREIAKQKKLREKELELAYPEFLNRLVLYMETGMSIRGSIFRIAEGYRKKQTKDGKKEFLYEELWYLCRQMKNGLGEKESYEILSQRCSLPCYKKLTALLIQYLQKGGSNMLTVLREEASRAGEEQKKRIRKQGEEIGTKLLFPMMILLGIVMVLIMIPACFSFQM